MNKSTIISYSRNILNQSEKLESIRNKIEEVAKHRDIEVLNTDNPVSLMSKIKLNTADVSHPNYFPELYLESKREIEITKDMLQGLGYIRKGAFKNSRSLTRISIPDDVNEIGDEAFMGATMLSAVDLPSRLTKLGKKCFANTEIFYISIPQSLAEIDSECFKDSEIIVISLPGAKRVLKSPLEGISKEIAESLIIVDEGRFDTYYNDSDYIWKEYRAVLAGKSTKNVGDILPAKRNDKDIFWFKTIEDAFACKNIVRDADRTGIYYFRAAESSIAYYGTFEGKVLGAEKEYTWCVFLPKDVVEHETKVTLKITTDNGLFPKVDEIECVIDRFSKTKGYSYDIIFPDETHIKFDSINEIENYRYSYSVTSEEFSGKIDQISILEEK